MEHRKTETRLLLLLFQGLEDTAFSPCTGLNPRITSSDTAAVQTRNSSAWTCTRYDLYAVKMRCTSVSAVLGTSHQDAAFLPKL